MVHFNKMEARDSTKYSYIQLVYATFFFYNFIVSHVDYVTKFYYNCILDILFFLYVRTVQCNII